MRYSGIFANDVAQYAASTFWDSTESKKWNNSGSITVQVWNGPADTDTLIDTLQFKRP